MAVSGASEPCTEFSPTDSANSAARIVPGAASAGLMAVYGSSYWRSQPSRTWATIGAEASEFAQFVIEGRSAWFIELAGLRFVR
jgi:hypothetical protein